MLAVDELFSLPGGGKSTAVSATADIPRLLTRHQVTAAWQRCSRFQKARTVALALMRLRRIVPAARLAFAASLLERESLTRLVRLLIRAEWLRAQSGHALFDQGLLQGVWSILLASGRTDVDPALLSPLLRSLCAGMEVHILHIDVSPAEAARRIAGRPNGHSRLDGRPAAEIQRVLEGASRLPHSILAAARLAGLQVTRIDGRMRPAALAARIRELVKADLSSRPRETSNQLS
jgi:hypothetical protein